MADLLDRLAGNVEEGSDDPQQAKIPIHYFYANLVAVADGQYTREEVEQQWNIPTEGASANQLDFIIEGYIDAADKGRYADAMHACFMLIESGVVKDKTEIVDWLTTAQQPYPGAGGLSKYITTRNRLD